MGRLDEKSMREKTGKNLMRLRKQAGYVSRHEIAEELGITESRYRSYETGQRGMSLQLAISISEAIGCTLDELVGSRVFIGDARFSRVERFYAGLSKEERGLFLDLMSLVDTKLPSIRLSRG